MDALYDSVPFMLSVIVAGLLTGAYGPRVVRSIRRNRGRR